MWYIDVLLPLQFKEITRLKFLTLLDNKIEQTIICTTLTFSKIARNQSNCLVNSRIFRSKGFGVFLVSKNCSVSQARVFVIVLSINYGNRHSLSTVSRGRSQRLNNRSSKHTPCYLRQLVHHDSVSCIRMSA